MRMTKTKSWEDTLKREGGSPSVRVGEEFDTFLAPRSSGWTRGRGARDREGAVMDGGAAPARPADVRGDLRRSREGAEELDVEDNGTTALATLVLGGYLDRRRDR